MCRRNAGQPAIFLIEYFAFPVRDNFQTHLEQIAFWVKVDFSISITFFGSGASAVA